MAEIDKTPAAYRIMGNIMVSVNKNDLKTELEQKKEKLLLRIKTLEKQENKLKEKASKTQEEVMKEMKQ